MELRKEDGFILGEIYLGRFWEVESDHTLKFAEKGLLDEIFGTSIVGVAVNDAFIL